SEPHQPELDSSQHWRRVMQGHAGANLMPVMASNRIGVEAWDHLGMSFYGGSFVAGQEGEILAEMDQGAGIALADLDLEACRRRRHEWGVFRDRRRDPYGRLTCMKPDLAHLKATRNIQQPRTICGELAGRVLAAQSTDSASDHNV
ncbi:MAG: hypothetical protein KTR21_08250, partial [Rhodobacteraceae bacterium]|nr:hypothetical protein [Paracoccaceae bacterium]